MKQRADQILQALKGDETRMNYEQAAPGSRRRTAGNPAPEAGPRCPILPNQAMAGKGTESSPEPRPKPAPVGIPWPNRAGHPDTPSVGLAPAPGAARNSTEYQQVSGNEPLPAGFGGPLTAAPAGGGPDPPAPKDGHSYAGSQIPHSAVKEDRPKRKTLLADLQPRHEVRRLLGGNIPRRPRLHGLVVRRPPQAKGMAVKTAPPLPFPGGSPPAALARHTGASPRNHRPSQIGIPANLPK